MSYWDKNRQESYPSPGYVPPYPPHEYPPPPSPGYPAPPSGYPPHPGPPYPPPGYQQGYQAYFNQGYPPPRQDPPNSYSYQGQSGYSSFLEGCLAALCCCCVLDECCLLCF